MIVFPEAYNSQILSAIFSEYLDGRPSFLICLLLVVIGKNHWGRETLAENPPPRRKNLRNDPKVAKIKKPVAYRYGLLFTFLPGTAKAPQGGAFSTQCF